MRHVHIPFTLVWNLLDYIWTSQQSEPADIFSQISTNASVIPV